MSDPYQSNDRKRLHVVILIHGINTDALWQNEISTVLREEGFLPAPAGYGRWGVLRFLYLPRAGAVRLVTRQVTDVRRRYPEAEISIIAHSFGSYNIIEFLRINRDINISRLILCGSVVPRKYDFAELADRFEKDDGSGTERIVNDCGTKDIWPILAGNVTWGYGASGTFGFASAAARAQNRWHNYFRHSDFLNEKFCREFWIPFLRIGHIVPGTRTLSSIPWYIRFISRIPIKYLVLALAILGVACWHTSDPPNSYEIYAGSDGIGFANDFMTTVVDDLRRSTWSCPTDCLRGRRRLGLDSVESEKLAELAIRGDFNCRSCYPSQALAKFQRQFPTCIRLEDHGSGSFGIGVNPEGVERWIDGATGKHWLLCKVRQPNR